MSSGMSISPGKSAVCTCIVKPEVKAINDEVKYFKIF
jgi:hypothetical protein